MRAMARAAGRLRALAAQRQARRAPNRRTRRPPTHPALLPSCWLQGDGVPPTEAREFCDWLVSAAAPRLDGLPFSVCALGDK